MLRSINNLIEKLDVEKAYKLIERYKEEYKENSTYWRLKGDLCDLVSEKYAAIQCYKKAIQIDDSNIQAIKKIIVLYDFINDINSKIKYLEILTDLENLFSKENVLKLIKKDFEGLNIEYINKTFKFKDTKWYYLKDTKLINYNELLTIDDYLIEGNENSIIIVPYDRNYINSIKYLSKLGVKECFVTIQIGLGIEFVKIDEDIMRHVKNEKYKSTITMSKLNAGDSNVYALSKYIPKKYIHKYDINLIRGNAAYNTENVVKIPLISRVCVSGHGVFLTYPYPDLMYNIEVGHGSMPFKTCGVMEKTRKDFAFRPSDYVNVDKVCATSTTDMILQSAFSWIPEDKFMITGAPRTDTLIKSDGMHNLCKLIGKHIKGMRIIFNMPTFHTHYGSGKIDGKSDLDGFIKIKEFDYGAFNKFLVENNMIFITKVHHGEQEIINNINDLSKLSNLYFISNEHLDICELDLYEILNSADLLVTDYSSIYSDFLFMNKATVFVNTDIDEYRKNRGLALEPYDFWTAGPKVNNQNDLEKEILKSIEDKSYYKEKRTDLRKVYHFNFDDKASERIWDFIDEVLGG